MMFNRTDNRTKFPARKQTGNRRPRRRGGVGERFLELLEQRMLLSTVPATPANVPALSSDPTATVKLYLDFAGQPASTWSLYGGSPISVPATPAYDVDGDPTTFNSTELANIQQIWARVAEKFSPFNVDVTTINPGSFPHNVALHMVIGGDGSWVPVMGILGNGITSMGEFYTSGYSTTAYDFSVMTGGVPKWTAESIAFQAGESFGLWNQAVYSSLGYKTNQANPGNSSIAPIMGSSVSATRGLWWYGPNTLSATTMQNDMAVLSGTNDGFGYRPDDHGNSIATATSLTSSGSTLSGSGIIEQTTDVDYFSFTTTGGQVNINVNGAQYGQMLNPKFQLFNSAGTLIATADNPSTLNNALTQTLAAGTYYVAVSGHGMISCYDSSSNYLGSGADVGQYTLAVTGAVGGSTDTTPPRVSLNPTYIAGNFISPYVSVTASDNVGVTRVELYQDGTLFSARTSGPFAFVLPTGYHSIQAKAYDAAGNVGVSTILSVAVPLPGDLNLDGTVTGADYNFIDANFGKTNATWLMGDLNGDGKVTGADYNFIDGNFGTTGGPVYTGS